MCRSAAAYARRGGEVTAGFAETWPVAQLPQKKLIRGDFSDSEDAVSRSTLAPLHTAARRCLELPLSAGPGRRLPSPAAATLTLPRATRPQMAASSFRAGFGGPGQGVGDDGSNALLLSPLLNGFIFGDLSGDLFKEEVLMKWLDPTDRALLARASRACLAAVVSSGLPRAGLS